jgi:hypothetical protein
MENDLSIFFKTQGIEYKSENRGIIDINKIFNTNEKSLAQSQTRPAKVFIDLGPAIS